MLFISEKKYLTPHPILLTLLLVFLFSFHLTINCTQFACTDTEEAQFGERTIHDRGSAERRPSGRRPATIPIGKCAIVKGESFQHKA